MRDRRRELRNNQTEAEKLLWKHISKKQLGGFRFNRQYGVGPYILDFYCPKIRLAIELDGSYHGEAESKVYDKEREKYLEILDIKIVRFWNNMVLDDIGVVLNKVQEKIIAIMETKEAPLR